MCVRTCIDTECCLKANVQDEVSSHLGLFVFVTYYLYTPSWIALATSSYINRSSITVLCMYVHNIQPGGKADS